MSRNEDVYNESHRFYPERFQQSGTQNGVIEDPRNIVFGYGRRYVQWPTAQVIWSKDECSRHPSTRLCPGRLFADTTLFLAIAGIVATLNIDKARDSEGNVITPEAEFFSAFVR